MKRRRLRKVTKEKMDSLGQRNRERKKGRKAHNYESGNKENFRIRREKNTKK